MLSIWKYLALALALSACAQAKFGGDKKSEDTKKSDNAVPCSKEDAAAGKCKLPDATPAGTDCSDLSEDECKAKKQSEGNDRSFRTVLCDGISAEACQQEVDHAIKDDGDQQSDIKVLGCREDAAKTCDKIDAMKNGEKGEVTVVKAGDVSNDGAAVKAPNFAFLVNDPQCAMCHVRFNGNVVSTSPLKGVRNDSVGYVNGNWYAASTWDLAIPTEAASAPTVKPTVNFIGGKIQTNYKGNEIPHDSNGNAVFPTFTADDAKAKAYGQLNGKDQNGNVITIDKVQSGNVVLVGSLTNPIKISGEVFIDGDLVIKGYYKGVGTVYVSGSIYIPANLRALTTAFPFNDNAAKASDEAKAKLGDAKTLYDGLALASLKSVFIADLEMIEPSQVIGPAPGATCTGFDAAKNCTGFSAYFRNKDTVYTSPSAPAGRHFTELGVDHVYSWIGGKANYDKLYESSYLCDVLSSAPPSVPGGAISGRGGFDLVEAFLYARNTVAGISRRNSYAINGGIIADHMHIISDAASCKTTEPHPVHKLPRNASYVNFDYRMKAGLPLLKLLRKYFEPVDAKAADGN